MIFDSYTTEVNSVALLFGVRSPFSLFSKTGVVGGDSTVRDTSFQDRLSQKWDLFHSSSFCLSKQWSIQRSVLFVKTNLGVLRSIYGHPTSEDSL